MRRGAGSALALKAQSCWACRHRGTRGPGRRSQGLASALPATCPHPSPVCTSRLATTQKGALYAPFPQVIGIEQMFGVLGGFLLASPALNCLRLPQGPGWSACEQGWRASARTQSPSRTRETPGPTTLPVINPPAVTGRWGGPLCSLTDRQTPLFSRVWVQSFS